VQQEEEREEIGLGHARRRREVHVHVDQPGQDEHASVGAVGLRRGLDGGDPSGLDDDGGVRAPR
jgi:hypothetical protein